MTLFCLFLTSNLVLTVLKWSFLYIAIILSALEEEPESDDEEDDTKIVNTSTKRPASGGGAKTPQVHILSVTLSAEFSCGLIVMLPLGASS